MTSMRIVSALFALCFSISAWAKLPGANTSMPEEYNSAYVNYETQYGNNERDFYSQQNYYNATSNPTGTFPDQGYQIAGPSDELANIISIFKSTDLSIFQKIMKGLVQPFVNRKIAGLFPTGLPQVNIAGLSTGNMITGTSSRQNCNPFQNNQNYRNQSQAQRFQ